MEEMATSETRTESSWDRIQRGEAPSDDGDLGELTVGIDFLTDFWLEKYFREYIADGGSKMKFITGRRGSGKSHLLRAISLLAEKESFITVNFSAHDVWLHDFKEIYLEVLRQCDIESRLQECAGQIVRNMGYDPAEIPAGRAFIDHLSERGEADALTKRELRNQMKEMFLDNPQMDNNFALSCCLLTGSILGHPMLEAQNKELLLGWLHCDKTVKLLQIRTLGLSPNRINKFNARHMLRSLAEVIRLSGRAGLVILIDDMEVLLNRSSLLPVHYTKMRRDDSYESIRQLIDEIDSMHNIMFLFGFDRELMDNENFGLKSYQALWMRIQNEVVGERYNRFADIVDLDRLGNTIYTRESLTEMSEKLADFAERNGHTATPLNRIEAQELLERTRVGNAGLPLMVNRRTLGLEKGGEGNV